MSEQTIQEQLAEQRFIRIGQFAKMSSLSRSTIWRHIKAGKLPAPIRLSDHIVAFKSSDVINWFEQREGAA